MAFLIGKALRVNTSTATSGAETSNFVGRCAGASNTTGNHNNFFGQFAGCSNTCGGSNIFIGNSAGCSNTSATANNFFGPLAGRSNTTGCNGNFIGAFAGCSNTTGRMNNFFGCIAGRLTSTGSHNNFFGNSAGSSNTIGSCNNFFGFSAGVCTGVGGHNNFFGWRAGRLNTSGFNNIYIGCIAGCANTTISNRIVMGNASHNCAQIQIGWTTVSDIRDKCVFGNVKRGKGFLKKLNPIEFAFKDRETDEIKDPKGKTRYGFSAQEVLEAEGDHPVIVSIEDPTKLQMTNDYLIPVLVNAIKEMSDDIDELKAEIAILKNLHA